MTRAYLRLDPEYEERKRSYPDGPHRCLTDILCLAEQEPKRGRFRSMAVLRALLGSRARHLPYLFGKHDLKLLEDGRIYVVGWDEWQEGNWQVAERMRRVRERRTVTDVTPDTVTDDVTEAVTPTVTVPSEPLAVSGKQESGAVTRRPSGRQEVNAWLREHQIASPVGWENSKLNELIRVNGPGHVLAAFEEARSLGGAVTCRNYIRWAEQTLNPDPSPALGGRSNGGAADEARQRFDRGVERTRREMAQIRGETA